MRWVGICPGLLFSLSDLAETEVWRHQLRQHHKQIAQDGPVWQAREFLPGKHRLQVNTDLHRDWRLARKDPAHSHQLKTILRQTRDNSEESRVERAVGQWWGCRHLQPARWGTAIQEGCAWVRKPRRGLKGVCKKDGDRLFRRAWTRGGGFKL